MAEYEVRYTVPKYGDFTGQSLYDGIVQSCSRSSYDPAIISEWIDSQAECYMDKEYDNEFIYYLITNYRMRRIMDVFALKQIDIENLDRDDIDKYIIEFAENEQLCLELKRLKELFIKHFDNERNDIAYEKASEDYQRFFDDIDENDDDEVADFFNVEYSVTCIKYEGEEYSINDCEKCLHCNRYIPVELMKKEWFEVDEIELEQDKFHCLHCDYLYNIDKEHIEHNKHIDRNEFVVRLI